jgi:predicted nucleotidyltransferase
VGDGQADRIIAALRAHEAELRAAGVRHVALCGSARGEAEPDSDVDLLIDLDPAASVGLLGALERRLTEVVGHAVDLVAGPIEQPRFRSAVERDLCRAF